MRLGETRRTRSRVVRRVTRSHHNSSKGLENLNSQPFGSQVNWRAFRRITRRTVDSDRGNPAWFLTKPRRQPSSVRSAISVVYDPKSATSFVGAAHVEV